MSSPAESRKAAGVAGRRGGRGDGMLNAAMKRRLLLLFAAATLLLTTGRPVSAAPAAGVRLLDAVRRGEGERAEILLRERGADPNVRGRKGVTPLIVAAGWGAPRRQQAARLCGLLLERGAQAGAGDWFGATPLMAAAGAGNLVVVERLLSVGVAVDATDKFGQTALFEAVRDAGALLGQTIAWKPSGGVCEGNNLFAAGLPNLDTLGVRGGDIHTEHEHAWPDSFVERTQLSALILSRLASGDIDARGLHAAMAEG